jgi:rhodanese-related sulfurtransferase
MTSDILVGTDWVQRQLTAGEPVFFVEVRHAGDHDLAVMKVRGALRMTSDEGLERFAEIPRERNVVVYTTAPVDESAGELTRLLLKEGFRAHLLVGGFKAYLSAGLPVEDIGAGKSMTRARGE